MARNLSARKAFGDDFAIFRPKAMANPEGLGLLESRKVRGKKEESWDDSILFCPFWLCVLRVLCG
jgi:hypothetical protein